jgi:hypothetical protein
MPIKRTQSSFWMMGTLILLVVILMMTLVYLQSSPKQQVKIEEKEQPIRQQPQVIVIDKSNDRLPVYPKDLPQYSSPDYQQVGILTAQETDKEPVILPLYGRKLYNRSDRWQYYTATDKNNMMRLPLNYENRDCEDDVGCKELYNGDKITVDIYKDREFTATIYRIDSPRYFADAY